MTQEPRQLDGDWLRECVRAALDRAGADIDKVADTTGIGRDALTRYLDGNQRLDAAQVALLLDHVGARRAVEQALDNV